MSIFGDGSSGRYNHIAIDKIKKNFHNLQQNQNLQSRQIQDELVLINLTRVELGDHRKNITHIRTQTSAHIKR